MGVHADMGSRPHMRRPALLSQVLTVNTLVIIATVFAASIAARLDLANSTGLRQFLVLIVAILTTILATNLVKRRRYAPLDSRERVQRSIASESSAALTGFET